MTDSLVDSTPQVLGGRYELLGLIGTGGMGSVYRARDRELDETVALKMLRRELGEQPEMLERFRREVKLARRVTHRNVARTFDIGEHGGDKFLTMEFVDGESLAHLLREHGMLSIAKVAEITGEICAGLTAAHAAGVIHRDLKPDNVLIASDGRVLITDFGIARAFDAGARAQTMGGLVGTPAYMAPEQVEGRDTIDARADLYALGVMLYEMCTGELPFSGANAVSVAVARLTDEPPDPRALRSDLPDATARIILRCMARKPEDRYARADEVAAQLSQMTLPAVGAPPPPPPRAPLPAPTATGEKSVAVLPFRNGGPPEDEYLAEGLTDDLIDTLSMTHGLRVRSRGSVMRLKGVDKDPRELGRELEVQVVVEGSLRRAASALRISTRMVSVADGFQLWARRWDRPVADVLAVGDEAARAIAEALTVEHSAPARDASLDPKALELYLRARQEYHRFRPEDAEKAMALFERALEIAPDNPMILSGYALACVRRWFFGGVEGLGRRAREAAERAVLAGPERGEAHLAMASVHFHAAEGAAAVRELKRAIAAAPSLAEAHELFGRILVESGLLVEGMGWLETALSLDPNLAPARWELTRAHALRGDWAKTNSLLEHPAHTALEVRGLWVGRLRMALWRRDLASMQYIVDHQEVMRISIPLMQMVSEMMRTRKMPELPPAMLTISGAPDEGRRRRAFFAQLLAEVASVLDEPDQALHWVTDSVEHGLADLAWLDHCPLLQQIREDARFVAQRAVVAARVAPVIAAVSAS
jgi:TolB-like protein/predicted Ser/Thr protein kinase